jgi:dTDP-3-amino-3,4,6-trideoxy-alpha-D-glucose transaminase
MKVKSVNTMNSSTVSMNDFPRQWQAIGADCMSAVERVGKSGWYVLGREVEAFEAELAEFCGTRFSVACANGLDAIEIALRAMGMLPGQKVLTTPLSAFATTLAIHRAGGEPVFVDVDRSGNIDFDEAERVLAADRGIRFMVPVHLFGHCLDLDRLEALRNRFDLHVVEDSAQAIGASFRGRGVGAVGQAATLSFYPTKNLGALGDGGALLTNDPELAKRFQNLRDYGQSSKYVHDALGLNSRLDELHAAILRQAMLPRLAAWLQRRIEIANRYTSSLDNARVDVVGPVDGASSCWHLFPVLVRDGGRDSLMAHLKEKNIQSGIHYPMIIPDQRAMAHTTQYRQEHAFSVARSFSTGEVSLPINPFMSDEEVDRVISAVNAWGSP